MVGRRSRSRADDDGVHVIVFDEVVEFVERHGVVRDDGWHGGMICAGERLREVVGVAVVVVNQQDVKRILRG